ncbi:hypothetical protein B0O80DRAFT_491896 [Mortierella sp. GBAus27b]|nr:hypothetical protein B0O80DRAFT_491896 [Mortierella sp. GBAus27b]
MLHIGGLTLCDDAKKLRIPNLVAAERFGNATLARLGLRLGDVDLAFQNIINTGDIRQALLLYRQMIWMRDVHPSETPGRIDMLITVPSAKRILVLEWKVLQLDFLDFGTRMTPEEKADHLKGIVELADYIASPEIAQLKMNHTVTAYLVVVVGSRQIVCWKMDNGQLRDEDVQLAA